MLHAIEKLFCDVQIEKLTQSNQQLVKLHQVQTSREAQSRELTAQVSYSSLILPSTSLCARMSFTDVNVPGSKHCFVGHSTFCKALIDPLSTNIDG